MVEQAVNEQIYLLNSLLQFTYRALQSDNAAASLQYTPIWRSGQFAKRHGWVAVLKSNL